MSRNLLILSVVLVSAVFGTAKPKPNCFSCGQVNPQPQFYPQYGYGQSFYPENAQQVVGGDMGAYAAHVQIPQPMQIPPIQIPQPSHQVQVPVQPVQQTPVHLQQLQVPVQQPQLQIQPIPVQQSVRYDLPPQPQQLGYMMRPPVQPAPCQ